MKHRALGAAIVSALTLVAASTIAGITGRTPPSPIVGITYDDVSNTGPELTTLESISRMPAVRIVFDTGEPASYYKGPISTFYPAAYIMGELIDSSYYIFADRPLEIDAKAAALLTPESRLLIGRLRVALWAVKDWTAEETETAMRAFADQNGLKFGAVAQPLRAALTGRTTSPGIFDVLAVLGRQESLARLDDQGPD